MNQKIYSHSSVLLLLLIFITVISLSLNADFLEYYYDSKISTDNEDTDKEENNCICDSEPNVCNEYCCCDKGCPKEAIEEWRNHFKCVDIKDTVITYADRCIDSNLVFTFNKKRGIRNESQTEDISKKEATILNFCYSMDNSKKEETNSESSSEEEDNEEKIIEAIDNYINQKYSGNVRNSKIEESNNANEQIKIISTHNSALFQKSGNLSLYSGYNCENIKNVQYLVPENYTCQMSVNESDNMNKLLYEEQLILKMNDQTYNCNPITTIYEYNNGLLKLNTNSYSKNITLEVDFILDVKNLECNIKIVTTDNRTPDPNMKYYTFTNSIVFSDKSDLPYRNSGNGGYLNGYPLIICDKNKKVFNKYYIIGREQKGDCREDSDFEDYLYYYDSPFVFDKDYQYICKKKSNNTNLKDTTLYKKINNIFKISKYGSYSIENINDDSEWIELDMNKIESNDNAILMRFYMGTNHTGIYSHKFIYSIDISSLNKTQNKETFELLIEFYDLEENPIYEQKPDYPTFVPKIPEDILDPLIYSEVDK